MLFKDGQIVGQKVGLPRKADLTALIDRTLSLTDDGWARCASRRAAVQTSLASRSRAGHSI